MTKTTLPPTNVQLAEQPKRMLPFCLLEILRRETDSEHRLTQKQIGQLLEQEYQIKVDRKTLKINLSDLINFGFGIECSNIERTNSDGDTELMTTDFYYAGDFDDSELRLLIDSILFSLHIPDAQKNSLINKLTRLSSNHFSARVKHVRSLPEIKTANKQLFYTIGLLDEAINRGHQVSFSYGQYAADGKLHARLDAKGEPLRRLFDPYQLVAANGNYYLICHRAPYDELGHYRVDRILDIQAEESEALPLTSLPRYRDGLDLPKHLAEHLYMFSGDPIDVRFRVQTSALSQVFDWFGNDVRLSNIRADGSTVDISITVNEDAMLHWAMQFEDSIEVMEPLDLRARLADRAKAMLAKYE